MVSRTALGLLLVTSAVLAFAACDDDSTPGGNASPDGGTVDGEDAGVSNPPTPPVTVTNLDETKQTGRIVRAQADGVFVGGATVKIGTKTAVTNDQGEYEIIAPRNAPYQMTVSADGFYKLIEQQWQVNKELLPRGDTSLLLKATADFLADVLAPPRDPAKGLLVVKVNPMAPCESEEGSTVALEPPGSSKVAYFGGSLPDSSLSAALKGKTFTALIYDVDVGVDLKVKVTSPLCAQVPFPIEVGDVTYTGIQRAEPGEVLSYFRTYIRDPVDAGTQ
jgi:hypothetical protein